ncbi:hypothetical protein ACR3AM_005468 [Bacillus thuringiensis]
MNLIESAKRLATIRPYPTENTLINEAYYKGFSTLELIEAYEALARQELPYGYLYKRRGY